MKFDLRSHIYLLHNTMIKLIKSNMKPQKMYAGFYNLSLKGRTSQRDVRSKLLGQGYVTVPYFVSCSSLQEEHSDKMKDFRVIILEEACKEVREGEGRSVVIGH